MAKTEPSVRVAISIVTVAVFVCLHASCTAQTQSDLPPRKVSFEDKFNQEELGKGWTWLREHKEAWRLQDGGLEIQIEPGVADTCKNVLLREAPDRAKGSWAIEVTVTSLKVPIQQYEQAGITWYSEGKPVFKLVKELVNGQLVIVPGHKPMTEKSVRLRLVVTADSWIAYYQPNAKGKFLEAASGKLPPPGKDQVSLTCYNGPPEAEHWVRFQDFRITEMAVDSERGSGK